MRSLQSIFGPITRIRRFSARAGAALLVSSMALALAAPGCNEGGEGNRCNPLLSHDECGGSNLVCSGPGTSHPLPGSCVENYCCPPDPTTSSNPECNGTDPVCGVMDGGSEAGEAASAEAGPEEAGPAEAGRSEAGSEGGSPEAGPAEAGPTEAGPAEAGPGDAASSDSGNADTGPAPQDGGPG